MVEEVHQPELSQHLINMLTVRVLGFYVGVSTLVYSVIWNHSAADLNGNIYCTFDDGKYIVRGGLVQVFFQGSG